MNTYTISMKKCFRAMLLGICFGGGLQAQLESFDLTAPEGKSDYQWYDLSSGAIAGETNQIFSTSVSGIYYAEYLPVGAYNCTRQTDFFVLLGAESVCGDTTAILDASEVSTNSAGATYLWFRDEVAMTNEVSATYTVTVADEGSTLYCEVTASNACDVAESEHFVVDVLKCVDRGDAPPIYGEATHMISNSFYLGTTVDGESNSLYSAGANGDDNDPVPGAGLDDEDGVSFGALIVPDELASIEVIASSNGLLQAWVDWNIDGDFGDANEQALLNQAVSPGTNIFSFAVPADAVIGETYARFRLSSQAGLGSAGSAPDGEVEDYRIFVQERVLVCNAPRQQTTFAMREAWRRDYSATWRFYNLTSTWVADMDNDGDVELIAGLLSSPSHPGGFMDGMAIYNHDGTYYSSLGFGYDVHSIGTSYAVADVNGDGFGEIVLAPKSGAYANKLVAYDRFFTLLWVSDQAAPGCTRADGNCGYAVQFADFNGDGRMEIYAGNKIFDGPTGVLLAEGGSGNSGGTSAGLHVRSMAADMDEDGFPELVAGNTVYDVSIANTTGSAGNSMYIKTLLAGKADGATVVADIDVDGDLDVIVTTTSGELYIWDGQTSQLIDDTASGAGIATIGNIDNDPEPEIIVTIVNLHCYEYVPGTGLVKKWELSTQDASSGFTGHSLFDFDGDGIQEIVYREELALYVIDGRFSQTGSVNVASVSLATLPIDSLTWSESPTIADIDNDGQAEIIITDKTTGGSDYQSDLVVIESAADPWQDATTVWNQENFHDAFINEDLSVSTSIVPYWKKTEHNGQSYYPGNYIRGKAGAQNKLVIPCDFGDAPTNYPTDYADDGPRHIIVSNLSIGTIIDADTNDLASANADGDDLDNTDDEEIAGLPNLEAAATSYSLDVPVNNSIGAAATLHGWVDFDLSGSFDAGEYTSISVPDGTSGSVNLSWTGLSGLPAETNTYARLRLSTDTNITAAVPGGQADDGEVEDYLLFISAPDYGDAPVSYGDASHTINALYLGALVDGETNSQYSADALLDGSDEDGVSFGGVLTQGGSVSVSVIASSNGLLQAWFDWNADGDFNDAGEQVFTDQAVSAGTNSLSIAVPSDAAAVSTYARFRLSSQSGLTSTGNAPDGEVEDYQVNILGTCAGSAEVISALKFSDVPGNAMSGWLNDGDNFGFSVANIGDVDNNGVEDLAVGAYRDDNRSRTDAGIAYVMLMNADGSVSNVTEIFWPSAHSPAAYFGVSVEGLGDLDGDGVEDIVVGAHAWDIQTAGDDQGLIMIFFLNADGTIKTQTTIHRTSGTCGGGCQTYTYGYFGISVANVGDVDGDGVIDLAVGEYGADAVAANAGKVWLLYMNSDGSAKGVTAYYSGVNGMPALAANDYFGRDMAGLGDVNGDGVPDLAVTSRDGGLYILMLDTNGVITAYQDLRVSDGSLPILTGGGNPDFVSEAGDFDGDGIPDLLLGDYTWDGAGTDKGAIYLLTLNSDGSAKNVRRIADGLTAALASQLDNSDYFGTSIDIVNIDGIGLPEIVVGVYADDDNGSANGGTDAGAVYLLSLECQTMDYGDAPASYGDASHIISNLYLGASVDGESNSVYSADALGDDTDPLQNAGPDDEDGVNFGAGFYPGLSETLAIAASSNGVLNAWVDWNADGDFDDVGEQVLTDQALSAGTNSLNIAVPLGIANGSNSYARFRLSSQSGLSATGTAPDGEVEDYQVTFLPYEICDNGEDDDGDGLTDCEDPDCALYTDCFSCDASNAVWQVVTPETGYNRAIAIQYTGFDQTFTIPSGVTELKVKAWGAGGGGELDDGLSEGGSGGYATGVINTFGDNSLLVVVGEGGKQNSISGTYGGGGAGGFGSIASYYGNSGGGLSGIFSNAFIQADSLIIAAGGGGSVDRDGAVVLTGGSANAGPGGGLIGLDSDLLTGGGTGPWAVSTGGTQSEGGTAGEGDVNTASDGSALQGGDANNTIVGGGCTDGGGGGGGGYFGGGGGAAESCNILTGAGQAGGGGSSFLSFLLASGSTIAGNDSTAPMTSDPQYIVGIGKGGVDSNGGNGLIVIQWNEPASNVFSAVGSESTSCDTNGAVYTVSLSVTNGTGPYTVTGSGAPGTWAGSSWTSDTIPLSSDYNITISDTSGCDSVIISNTAPICPEICGDGIDNDGDGLADCFDGDCATNNACDFFAAACGDASGGSPFAQFIGAEGAYRLASATSVNLNIPAGADYAILKTYALVNVGAATTLDENKEESWAFLDFKAGNSSGIFVEQLEQKADNSNMMYYWEDHAFGSSVSGSAVGPDLSIHVNHQNYPSYNVSNNTLTITESSPYASFRETVYYVEYYDNDLSMELLSTGVSTRDITATNYTAVTIPAGTDYIKINKFGSENNGTSSGVEGHASAVAIINVKAGSISGVDFVGLGNPNSTWSSAFYFEDKPLGSPITDDLGHTSAYSGFTTYSISGTTLSITAPSALANETHGALHLEFFRANGPAMNGIVDFQGTQEYSTMSFSLNSAYQLQYANFIQRKYNVQGSSPVNNEDYTYIFSGINVRDNNKSAVTGENGGSNTDPSLVFDGATLAENINLSHKAGYDPRVSSSPLIDAVTLTPDSVQWTDSSGTAPGYNYAVGGLLTFSQYNDIQLANMIVTQSCDTLEITVRVCNPGQMDVALTNYPISVYAGDPRVSGATLLHTFTLPNTNILVGNCLDISLGSIARSNLNAFELYAVINDDGSDTLPIVLPDDMPIPTDYTNNECNYSNNFNSVSMDTCLSEFGDAPVSYGDAEHALGNLYIGATVDGETNSQYSADALLDGADEDGVTVSNLCACPGSAIDISVSLTNGLGTNATLVGWIDFDGSGTFDAAEGVSASVATNATNAMLSFTATNCITATQVYARFRLSSDALTLSNATGAASDGEVEDYLFTVDPCTITITNCPAGLTNTAGPGCATTVPDFTTGIGAINSCGDVASITVTQVPAAGSAVVGPLTTNVQVIATDICGNADTCNVPFVVECQTNDLSIVKQVSDTAPNVGDTITYTITVTNLGPMAALDVSVSDTLPTGLTYVAASISGGDSNNAAGAPNLSWTMTNMAVNISATLSFNAVVNSSEMITNIATVTCADCNPGISPPVVIISQKNHLVAIDDFNNSWVDTPVSGNVALNDIDPENNNLTINTNPVSGPSSGIVSINTNGTYLYTPDPAFVGEDTFTYEVCDDGTPALCDTATVTVTVSDIPTPGVNDPPVANNDTAVTEPDTPVDGDLLNNDYDLDGDPVTVNTNPVSGPANGSVTINPDGTYTYTPTNGFVGEDSFVYEICDDGTPAICDTATVAITVMDDPNGPDNDPPNPVEDYGQGPENTPITGDLLPNDSDPNGDPITISTNPIVQPQNGTVVINPNGSYTYTPNPNYTGPDSFVYELCDDQGACAATTAHLLLNPVNHLTAIDDFNNSWIDTPVSGNVLVNDIDPEDNTMTLNTNPVSGPVNGSVTLGTNGNYTYTPNPGFVGEDSFTYEVCDDGTPALCDTATVTVTVSDIPTPGVNDPPVANNDTAVTEPNTPVDGDLLNNDYDLDGDPVTVNTNPVSGPANGSVTINPDGTYTYTPTNGFVGEDSFVYEICDDGTPAICDTATVAITVMDDPNGPDNDPPNPVEDYGQGPENTPITGDLLPNDSDPNGDPITITTNPVVQPQNGTVVINPDGSYTYTPNPNYTGPDSFVYEVCDDQGACAETTVHLLLNPVNHLTAIDDFNNSWIDTPVSGNVLVNDIDPETNNITINTNPVNGPTSGSVSIDTNGNYTYTPNPGFVGEDSFAYEVCDDGTPALCDTATVTVTVSDIPTPGVNDPPVANNDTAVTEPDTPVDGDLLNNDYDLDGDPVTVNTNPLSGPANGSVTINPDGTYTYTPTNGFVGEDSFEYEICDDGTPAICDTATVAITVMDDPNGPNNDPPNPVEDYGQGPENTPITGDLLPNDSDPNGDPITITTNPVVQPQNGTVVINPDGSYTYTPNPNYTGPDSFVYEVCDDQGACAATTAHLLLNPESELALGKSVSNTDPLLGDTITYTIIVTNLGPGTAADVVINDVIPAGLSYVPGSISGGDSNNAASAPNLTWSITNLAVSAVTNLSFLALVVDSGVMTNVATGRCAICSSTNSPPVVVTVLDPIVTMNKELLTALPLFVGDIIEFEMSSTNVGPVLVTGVDFHDFYDTGYLAFLDANVPPDDPADDGQLDWTAVGPLAIGASTTIIVRFTVVADTGTGDSTNVLTGTWPGGGSSTSQVSFAIWDYMPGIDVEKSTNGEDADTGPGPSLVPGSAVAWTYVVTNTGNVALTNVVLTDDLEGTPTYLSGDDGNGILEVGESWTFTASANAGFGEYSNLATVVGSCACPTNITAQDQDPSHYIGINPTVVIIERVSAFADANGEVWVEWKTASELQTVGFYLERLGSSGGFVRVIEELIPSVVTNGHAGTYSVLDAQASLGDSNMYRIVEMMTDGSGRLYGPFPLTVGAAPLDFLLRLDSAREVELRRMPFVRLAHPIDPEELSRLAQYGSEKEQELELREWLAGEFLELRIVDSGIHFIGAEEIAWKLDIPLWYAYQLILAGELELSGSNGRVSFLPAVGGEGLYFYGEAHSDVYSAENVYRLQWGLNRSVRTVHGGQPAPAPGGLFRYAKRFGEDKISLEHLSDDPDADYLVWKSFFKWGAGEQVNNITIPSVGRDLNGADAWLSVRMQGGAAIPGVSYPHGVSLVWNGTEVAARDVGGLDVASFDISLASDQLLPGDNTLAMHIYPANGASYAFIYLDDVTLEYDRNYVADSDKLAFRAPGSGTLTVSGFSQADILLLDITSPKNPRWIERTTIDQDGGSYRISFVAEEGTRNYFACLANQVAELTNGLARFEYDLHHPGIQADYLLIGSDTLLSEAQRLADYRSGKGLQPRVIDVADIFSAFNHGRPSPQAIKDFLTYARKYWKVPPKYALLCGDGSSDYRNLMGLSTSESLVPSRLQQTPHGLYASDTALGDVDEDGVPDIAIGRLPALTQSELGGVIDKIIAYEAADGNGWKDQVLFVADTPDTGGDFHSATENLNALVSPLLNTQVILNEEASIPDDRNQLFTGLNAGTALLNYVGHGAMDYIGNQLLHKNDMSQLNNAGRETLLLAMSCVISRFNNPGNRTLAEELLLKADGGAIAVIGPSGWSYNHLAVNLNTHLLEARYNDGIRELGALLKEAMKRYQSEHNEATWLLHIYNLLGDPAMEMK